MPDPSTIMSYGREFAPALGAILAAALAVWIVWRILRRAWQIAFGGRERPAPGRLASVQERREPILGPPEEAPSSPTPDMAGLRALKESIDALTRQIASLERKLTPAQPDSGKIVPITSAVGGEETSRIVVKPPLSS